MSPAQEAALRALCGKRAKPALKRLFALIRVHDDRVLFAAIAPARKRAAKRRGDPMVREIETALRPILGRAAEKAELLVEHMAKKHRRKLAFEPKGVADAVRRLRATFSDAQIRVAAKSLMAEMAELYSAHETVV